jgi:hypothetical protein
LFVLSKLLFFAVASDFCKRPEQTARAKCNSKRKQLKKTDKQMKTEKLEKQNKSNKQLKNNIFKIFLSNKQNILIDHNVGLFFVQKIYKTTKINKNNQ